MRQNESLRELSADELDLIAGGLSISAGATASVGAGVNVNANDVFSAVSGLLGQVGSLATGVLGDVLGAVGGVTKGL